MKIMQSSSVIPVSCMAAASIAVIMSVGIAAAGPRFNPQEVKGGLPACMDNLNEITANLETCETNLVEAQEESTLLQEDLETCNMGMELLLEDLAMYEENGGASALILGVPKTGQTNSYGVRDDGELQKGTAWPEERFSVNFTDNEEDGTVTDNMTGLVWTKNANRSGEKQTWSAALNVCNALADNDFDLLDDSLPGDWRLPNVRELQSLIDYGRSYPALPEDHLFDAVQKSVYWTSTSASNYFSWGVSLANGNTMADSYTYKVRENGFVWCVRDGQ